MEFYWRKLRKGVCVTVMCMSLQAHQVRPGDKDSSQGPTPNTTPAAVGHSRPGIQGHQQQPPSTAAARARGSNSSSTGVKRNPKAPKGCWLDNLKVQAAAKRKAAILAAGASKRAAVGQGATAAAAGHANGNDAAAADGLGDVGDAMGGGGHNGHSVLYKFNEGYTNAVKRPIKVAELLGN